MLDADYCEIQLGGPHAKRRGVALVDAADAAMVGAYSWRIHREGYAERRVYAGGKVLAVLMHRELLGLVRGDGHQVDHVNGNTLDNRRANLRVCTNAENHQNLHERPYRGATWEARRNLWQARAKLAGKTHHLGRFATREEAATVAAAFRREHMPFSADARTPAA
jgi:hypothetical protein